MKGGNIALDEKSIREILRIGALANHLVIQKHNDLLDRTLKTSPDLQPFASTYRVNAPPRQAADGKFYIPDPNRPGKYLQQVR